MRHRDTAGLLLLSVIWGAAFLFIRVVVREVPPATVVAGRLTLAAVIIAPLAARRAGVLPPRAVWPVLLFLAVFNNVIPFVLITAAEEHISSSLAAAIIATMPLFTLIFAVAGGTERASAEKVAGLCIGFAGVVLLVGPDVTDVTSSSTVGEFAVIAAAACYAISTVVAREKASGDSLSLASGQMIFAALVSLPLAALVDGRPPLAIGWPAALSWLGLGALCSGAAYVIFFVLVQRLRATQVAIVTYLVPVVAALLGWLVLDERIGINLGIGLVLIVLGVTAVNGSLRVAWGRLRGDGTPAAAGT
ncbi:MAG TPA: DMT family transporter [Dehalococcoidia bacterium]|nr:DMT family transporter [Dehalococcoidia bacterium]